MGCPPSSKTPDSNEVRVRVEGWLKISATVRPSSAREECGAAFNAAARCSRRLSRPASSSAPVRKCDAGIDVEPLPRPESPTFRAVAAERVRGGTRGGGGGGRRAAGGAAVVAGAVGRGDGRERALVPDLPQLRSGGAAGRLGAQPRCPEGQRR